MVALGEERDDVKVTLRDDEVRNVEELRDPLEGDASAPLFSFSAAIEKKASF